MPSTFNNFRIHFVCTGNTFRSRLAEALLKSKELDGVTISSSGIDAEAAYDGPITWYGARLAFRYGLIPYLKPYWSQTKTTDVKNADLVIFMSKKHCDYCLNKYQPDIARYEIWDVPDISDLVPDGTTYRPEDDLAYIAASEKSFEQIRQKVEELTASLRSRGRG